MASLASIPDATRRAVGDAREFLARGVWERDYSRQRGVRGFLVRQTQVLLLVGRGMQRNQIPLRAASLTLTTLFSIVPALAVVFSVFQAVGGLERVRQQVQGFIYANVAVGAQQDLVDSINRFVSNIHGRAVGGIGFAFLLFAAVRLLGAMEASFNEVWGVRRPRPLLSRLTIYWVLLTVGPIALAASLTGTAALQGWLTDALQFPGSGLLFSLAPAGITISVFVLAYMVIPYTEVRFRHALVGGVAAGILFEGAKLGYTWVAENFFSYNAVYGSVGAIPVFIIWVNIAWLLVLFGCELTFAYQNVRTMRHEERVEEVNQRFRELVAVRAMLEVAVDFYRCAAPPTAQQISDRTEAPVRLIQGVLRQLADAEVVRESRSEPAADPGYLPARVLDRLTVGDVIRALRQQTGVALQLRPDDRLDLVGHIVQRAEEASEAVYLDADFLELARRFGEGPARRPSDTDR